MSDTYSLQKDVIRVIFSKIINPEAFNFSKNSNHVYKILTEELSDSSVEAIIHLMLLESEYKALKIGDYVKIKPPNYHKRSEYEVDILSDMGLLPADNDLVYGKVVGDSSWSTDKPFNPFYSRIKLELLYHDTEKNLKLVPFEINPMFCTRITKNAIKYFKNGMQTELALTNTVYIDNPDNF